MSTILPHLATFIILCLEFLLIWLIYSYRHELRLMPARLWRLMRDRSRLWYKQWRERMREAFEERRETGEYD